MTDPVPVDATNPAVDAEHPWLGLASFTEESRAYFHGRDDDAAELARRVQRKLLTVLFGQSGHGKTSLLRAALVPRLRPEGYCPVYVRLDYSPGAPTPAEQIKEAIMQATQAAGHWTQQGSSVAGESLWEFLHHRDDVLQDTAGRPLVPLLIFDQFEEVFTLAQADDAGRERAQAFLSDLADLVENRPPVALAARIDLEEADAAKFDFSRADYRVLLSLREDYLAHLEGLKATMPSVTQNRVRLARFTGAQAIAAVRGPAPRLVTEEVAGQVVRFVSGGTDLARAEVEPSLLSLVCRELNNARLARGQATITADLLEGSRETILQEFYARALADQPAGIRRFIEDELLTDSGYRESVAEERVKKAFAVAGASPGALAVLVGRRLLRVEERLDVRRVELTHDVLCGVVAAGRGVRREREAKELAEAQLKATQQKEAATQQALWRARRVALVCAVLAAGAIGSAVFGYFNYRRARLAETEAVRAAVEARKATELTRGTQEMAEAARTEAEKIVTYLLADFYNELEPVGRLDIVGELAKRAVDYYRALPLDLRSPITVRNQALALVRYGSILVLQGKTDDGALLLDEAIRTFERLESNGDHSDDLYIGLTLSYRNQARLLFAQRKPEAGLQSAERSVASVRAAAEAAGASRALRREFAESMSRLGFHQLRTNQSAKAVVSMAKSREIYTELGALNGSDPQLAAAYADGTPTLVEASVNLGKAQEIKPAIDQALLLAGEVLRQNPADRRALRAKGQLGSSLGYVYGERLQLAQARAAFEQGEQSYAMLLQLDPTNSVTRNNLMAVQSRIIRSLFDEGLITRAMEKGRQYLADAVPERLIANSAAGPFYGSQAMARWYADLGNQAEAAARLKGAGQYRATLLRDLPPEAWTRQVVVVQEANAAHIVALFLGDNSAAYDGAKASLGQLATLLPKSRSGKQTYEETTHETQTLLAEAALRLGRLPEAEIAAREALNALLRVDSSSQVLEAKRSVASARSKLALVLARQGRQAEALALVEPVLIFERELASTGDSALQHAELAFALYVAGLAQPASNPGRARELLEEADTQMNHLPAEVRALRTQSEIASWIAAARKNVGN